MTIGRRSLLAGGTAAFAGLACKPLAARQARFAPTVPQTIGPFYPVVRPLDQDADLTIVRGRRGRARGRVIEVVGRVLDLDGRPVPNAKLDLWQANAAGRYAHPGDDNPAPLDPDFQGSAAFTADAEGRFRFRTVKPGAYPGRVPHLHFDVRGRERRIVTQMYFPGEPGNSQDSILARIPAGPLRERLIPRSSAAARSAVGTLTFEWDIVLGAG
jgi:protocatechuate 3,4-dioxygenase beta subunit